MPRKRFKFEQIIQHLREAEVAQSQGQTMGQVCSVPLLIILMLAQQAAADFESGR